MAKSVQLKQRFLEQSPQFIDMMSIDLANEKIGHAPRNFN